MSNDLFNDLKHKANISSINRKLSSAEKVIQVIGDKIVPEHHVPFEQRLKVLTVSQKEQLQAIEQFVKHDCNTPLAGMCADPNV